MSMNNQEKHKAPFPTARGIRRACGRELYRTIKKLKQYIPPQQVAKAEEIYFKKVALNLVWVFENRSNRKAQADWWVENVCPEIAPILNIEPERLAKAFRDSYGG